MPVIERRVHTHMCWIAQQLDARERKAVSFYYAGLPFNAGTAKDAGRLRLYHEGDPARGLVA